MPETDEIPADRTGAPAPGSAETALLHDLVRWREQIARSIARNNLSFRSGQIMTAVNCILFPLLLLAVAEDRHLLPAGTIALLQDRPDGPSLPAVLGPFADDLYAGGITDASPSSDPAGNPVLEERVIQGILGDLASPVRQYDFRLVSTESLAQVLTQYLARTIRRSAAHHAAVVDAHDTVLSGGTVVPPLVIIRSMADQALDAARKNRSRKEILPLRILDPACGPGTVLIEAYRCMLGTVKEPALTFEERCEILVQSIHGVDMNLHAVAAARMLLVLELLENHGRSGEPGDFLALVHPVFKDLRHTILCGNALVGPEITGDESWNFCPPQKRHDLNLFSWDDHFTEIRAAGGFDIVICNPPEGAVETHEWIQQYFQRHYSSYHRAADRSAYFVEKGLTLLRTGSTLAFVMRSRWLRGTGGSPLRGILKNRRIDEITEYPGPDLCSIRVRNARPSGPFTVVRSDITGMQDDTGGIIERERFPVDPAVLDEGGWALCDTRTDAILAKVEERGTPVMNFCMGESGCGALKRADKRLFLSREQRNRLVKKDRRSNDLLRPFVEGHKIGRYQAKSNGHFFFLVPPREAAGTVPEKTLWRWMREQYPAVARHLKTLDPAAATTAEGKAPWYMTGCSEAFRSKDLPKILFPCRSIAPVFTFDDGRSVIDRDAGYLVTSSLYLLAVLNSRLARFWFMHRQLPEDTQGLQETTVAVAGFFIHVPDFDNPPEADRYARIEALARRMLVYHEQLAHEHDETASERFRKKIERTDRQIDALVYEEYGLTAEEITVIEESVGR